MGKNTWKCRLERALFVLLVMVGAVASAVLDVRAVASAMAAGKHGLAPGAVVVAASPATAASAPRRANGTLVARIAH